MGEYMKKLYVLFGAIWSVSSSFAADRPLFLSRHYDDCDRSIIDRGATVVHMKPDAQSSCEQHLVVPNNTPEHLPACATAVVPINSPALRLYYSTGNRCSVPLIADDLQASYNALNKGQHFYVTFKPDLMPPFDQSISFWDTYPWLANVRAWGKWWLNPWAWWDPSRYLLDKNDCIEWDETSSIINMSIAKQKDVRYLTSQLRMFLLTGWNARFAPYIVPTTRGCLEEAIKMRFIRVEKPALENAGFKNVELETRVNLTTQCLEYCVNAKK